MKPFGLGSMWERELTLVNAKGQPLRHHPLLLTVYDKAPQRSYPTTLLWQAIGGGGIPYLYNKRAVMEVAPSLPTHSAPPRPIWSTK